MISRELIKKLRRIEIRTSRLANDQLAGSYHSVFKGRGMAFSEVRQYQPGDDVRFIDWNVSARMQETYVKLFTEEREMTVMLLVDLSQSQLFGTGERRKIDTAAEVAALLAFSAIKNNDRVGLILFSDRVERFVPPKKGRGHVMRVVTEILQAKPQGQRTDLRVPLDLLGHVSKRRAVAFVISDFLAGGYEHSLRVVARRHDLIPVQVIDQREQQLADVGLLLVEDLESGARLEIDSSRPQVRQAYAESVGRQQAERHRLFRKLRLDHVTVDTQHSYVQPISELFRARAQRLRGYR